MKLSQEKLHIRSALLSAISWEKSLLDALQGASGETSADTRARCTRKIAVFTRLLDQKYGGAPDDPLANATTVSIYDVK